MNETGKPSGARARVSEPVFAAACALVHYGPHTSGDTGRAAHPGLRWPGGGRGTDQALSAPEDRLGSVPVRPAVLPAAGGSPAGDVLHRDGSADDPGQRVRGPKGGDDAIDQGDRHELPALGAGPLAWLR